MNISSGRLLIIILPLILIINYLSRADKQYDEAIFSITYAKYSAEYIVYLDGDKLYLPLEEVLAYLNIFYTVDENRRVEGYVNRADSSYFLDINKGIYRDISGEDHTLTNDQWFGDELNTYVASELFASIFKVEVKSYFNQLKLSINSKYEMPVKRAAKVAYISNNFNREQKEEDFGPLLYERNFHILNGGILDYNFSANKSGPFTNFHAGGNLGMVVLGGELQYNSQCSYNEKGINNYQQKIRWRYLFDSKAISSISLGNLMNYSYRSTGSMGYNRQNPNLFGVQVTNEDPNVPNVFSHFIVEDRVEPDWTVELYLNDHLSDVQKTDPTGYYRFEIPTSYGATKIEVKYYGPRGEFETESKVINIPTELLPPGELKYVLSAGQDIYTRQKGIDGTVSVGLLDWITTSVSGFSSLERINDYNVMSSTNFNLFRNLLLRLTATNTGVYESSLKISNTFLPNLNLTYTVFDRSQTNNRYSNQLSVLNLNASFSRFLFLPVSYSLMLTRNQYATTNLTMVASNFRFNIWKFNFSFRHNLMLNDDMKRIGNIRQNLNADLSIYIDKYPGFLKHLGQSRISLIADIEPASRQVRYLSAIVSQHITRDIYLTSNYTIYPDTRVSQFSLSLNCNLPMFRNQTTANQYQGRSMAYSTAFSGSVEFDSYNMRLSMLNSMGSTNNFGRSSAAVQFYNDRNYNNEFDEGDKAINEVDFFVSNSTTQKTNVGNYKILSNLIPNKRYNIRVKPESFSNPSLIPQYTEFSFVTEPYSYKAINIPCHMGGMLEGIVKKLIPNGESVGQGGLKLHIVSKSSDFTTVVKVFSDGSFFYNGLPVGDYEIFIDDKQLEILSCTSEPQTIAFTVKPMSDGDYIDNLNFQIKPTVDKLEIQSSN